MITNPQLQLREGYVEVETEKGRTYKKVDSEIQKMVEGLVRENSLLKAQLQAQLERSEFLEDCIAELAIQAYQ